jgi:hypothetical protein
VKAMSTVRKLEPSEVREVRPFQNAPGRNPGEGRLSRETIVKGSLWLICLGRRLRPAQRLNAGDLGEHVPVLPKRIPNSTQLLPYCLLVLPRSFVL